MMEIRHTLPSIIRRRNSVYRPNGFDGVTLHYTTIHYDIYNGPLFKIDNVVLLARFDYTIIIIISL